MGTGPVSADVGVGPPRVRWSPHPINPGPGANNQFSILIIYHGLLDRGIYFPTLSGLKIKNWRINIW